MQSQSYLLREVIHIREIYPVLGYVSQASESDLANSEIIKKNHVPGLRVAKIGLESFENDLIGSNGIKI